MVSGPSKSSSSATVTLTLLEPVVCPDGMEIEKADTGVKSSASAVPGSVWPTIITVAGVTAVEDREPDREPETITVSSLSRTGSGLTVKSKVALPVDSPSAMVMAVREPLVKSPRGSPLAAVPPATVRVTVVPPAGATTPSGRAAVTVIVCVFSAASSLTRDGLTRRVAAAGSGSAAVIGTGSTTATVTVMRSGAPPLP